MAHHGENGPVGRSRFRRRDNSVESALADLGPSAPREQTRLVSALAWRAAVGEIGPGVRAGLGRVSNLTISEVRSIHRPSPTSLVRRRHGRRSFRRRVWRLGRVRCLRVLQATLSRWIVASFQTLDQNSSLPLPILHQPICHVLRVAGVRASRPQFPSSFAAEGTDTEDAEGQEPQPTCSVVDGGRPRFRWRRALSEYSSLHGRRGRQRGSFA